MRLAWCLLFAVLVGAALLTACDSGGGMDDDDPPPPPSEPDSVTVSAEAVTEKGSRVDSAAILFDGTQVGTARAEKTYEEDSGREITIRAEEDDFVDTEETVSLSGDQSLSLEMLEELPETVTVPFANVATDGDSLVAHAITWEDSVVVESPTPSGTAEIPGSREEGKLCAQESDLFLRGCITIVPTSDFAEAKEIPVDRKTVTLSVTPDPPYGDPAETDVTIYEPFLADSTKFVGSNSVELPKRKDGINRQVVTDLITDDPEKSGALDRLVADTTVTANGDVELYAQPSLVPACSDEINSDQDPFEKDENDPGCYNREGTEYNPDDDNELHSFVQITIGKFYDDSTFVSSTAGERTALVESANTSLPQSVTVAIGDIFFGIEIKPLGGGFAIHIKSGDDNDNLTVAKTSDVVKPDSTNSWGATEVYGIDRTFFADGPHYAVYAWDSTKANGEPPVDTDKLVIFYEGIEDTRAHLIEYFYEPDHPDLQNGSSSAKTAGISQDQFTALDNGEYIQLENGRVYKNGVPDDLR